MAQPHFDPQRRARLIVALGTGVIMLAVLGLWWWQTGRTFRQIDQQGGSTIGQIWQRSREQAGELIGQFPTTPATSQKGDVATPPDTGGDNATTRQRDNANLERQAIEALRQHFMNGNE